MNFLKECHLHPDLLSSFLLIRDIRNLAMTSKYMKKIYWEQVYINFVKRFLHTYPIAKDFIIDNNVSERNNSVFYSVMDTLLDIVPDAMKSDLVLLTNNEKIVELCKNCKSFDRLVVTFWCRTYEINDHRGHIDIEKYDNDPRDVIMASNLLCRRCWWDGHVLHVEEPELFFNFETTHNFPLNDAEVNVLNNRNIEIVKLITINEIHD